MHCRGSLGPDEYSTLSITYRPRHTGTFSCESFTLATPGGNRLAFNLRGHAVGPLVTLSTRSFNFGSLPVNQAASRVLYLQNHAEVLGCTNARLQGPHCMHHFRVQVPLTALCAKAQRLYVAVSIHLA
jgi:hypothetical protein